MLHALPAPKRRALAVALLIEDAAAPLPPRALAVSFLAALRELASCGPLVIAVDDVQWLDPTTLDLLSFAARRLKTERVLFLLAAREDSAASALGLARCVPQSRQVQGRSAHARRVGRDPPACGSTSVRRDRCCASWRSARAGTRSSRSSWRARSANETATRRRASFPFPQTLQALVQERLASPPAGGARCPPRRRGRARARARRARGRARQAGRARNLRSMPPSSTCQPVQLASRIRCLRRRSWTRRARRESARSTRGSSTS